MVVWLPRRDRSPATTTPRPQPRDHNAATTAPRPQRHDHHYYYYKRSLTLWGHPGAPIRPLAPGPYTPQTPRRHPRETLRAPLGDTPGPPRRHPGPP
ncbi:unnamed protein product [Boreogadus saida]